MAITATNIDKGVEKARDYSPVEPGTYTLKIYKTPTYWVSQSGNPCLRIALAHVSENIGGAGAHRGVMSKLFIDKDGGHFSMDDLAGILRALGVSEADLIGTTFQADPEVAADENGRGPGIIVLGNGERFDLPVGALVRAFVKITKNQNGEDQNDASFFKAYTELA